MKSKQLRETRKTELVETHNLAISLGRLGGAPYDNERWRRALYHAISMTHSGNITFLKKIREALDLP